MLIVDHFNIFILDLALDLILVETIDRFRH